MDPIPQHYTETIAKRTFEAATKGSKRPIVVEIGTPINDVPTVDGLDWRCPVKVSSRPDINVQSACGIDSIQALELACKHLIYILAKQALNRGETLTLWGEPLKNEEAARHQQ